MTPVAVVGRTRRLYSASFKAELIEQCRQAGVSSAAVAISHGMNPNVLRRWIKESESGSEPSVEGRRPITATESSPPFVALALEAALGPPPEPASSAPDLRIELQRNGITVSVTWPASRGAESAAWVREVLR
jgi:transposase